jgi:mannose-6-phosphate isomerase-like protein (cupin superfamily)
VQLARTDADIAKGWYWGPWNSDLGISVGFANRGVDEPHVHTRMTEIYLVACGSAEMRIETETVALSRGQVLIVEPGEAHTFLASSADHFHFVLQIPGLEGEEARLDKVLVPRSRLGL